MKRKIILGFILLYSMVMLASEMPNYGDYKDWKGHKENVDLWRDFLTLRKIEYDLGRISAEEFNDRGTNFRTAWSQFVCSRNP